MASTIRRGAVRQHDSRHDAGPGGPHPGPRPGRRPVAAHDARRRAGLDHPRRPGRPDPGRPAAAPHRRPRPARRRRRRVPRGRRLRPRERGVRRLRLRRAVAGPVRPPQLRRGRRDRLAAGPAGFTVGAIPANHRTISFSGTTAQVEKAFATDLQTFRRSGSTVTANAASVSVPRALAGTVVGISGLDTSALRRPDHTGGPDTAHRRLAAPATAAAGQRPRPPTRSPARAGLPQRDALLDLLRPEGRHLGAADPHRPAHLRPLRLQAGADPGRLRRGRRPRRRLRRPGRDRSRSSTPTPRRRSSPTRRPTPAGTTPGTRCATTSSPSRCPRSYSFVDECDAAGWYGEETLDVEAAHATAPAANILYVGASSCQDADLNAAMNTVVDNELAQVISNSYGSTGEPASTGRRRGRAPDRSCRRPPRASA